MPIEWRMDYLIYSPLKRKQLVLGGVWSQGWNLKELTEGHHQEWSLRLNLTQHGETHQVQTQWGLTDWELFHDFVGGGAWPFLVGGVICLLNCDNGRDFDEQLVKSHFVVDPSTRTADANQRKRGNNRSVMPLDVLGRTRATLTRSTRAFV